MDWQGNLKEKGGKAMRTTYWQVEWRRDGLVECAQCQRCGARWDRSFDAEVRRDLALPPAERCSPTIYLCPDCMQEARR